MIAPKRDLLEENLDQPAKIQQAFRMAAERARQSHAQAGRSVPIARDGQIVWLRPEEILTASDLATAAARDGQPKE